ncbi:MAG: DUF2956 family protein [Gammaproteobacteria bacterium]|nr:DUF2956 family protein [Gammaproteobacteria bacterium]
MSKNKQSENTQSFEAQAAQSIKEEAEKIANATQAPGQTKSETKLITQGIAKGIEAYKKQEKAKARERSKNEKKKKQENATDAQTTTSMQNKAVLGKLARLIKYLSNFMAFLSLSHFSVIFLSKSILKDSIQWVPIIAISLGILYLLASFFFLKISKSLRDRAG